MRWDWPRCTPTQYLNALVTQNHNLFCIRFHWINFKPVLKTGNTMFEILENDINIINARVQFVVVSKIKNIRPFQPQENVTFMKTVNSKDPKIEPCGIPKITSAHSLCEEPILVLCLRNVSHSFIVMFFVKSTRFRFCFHKWESRGLFLINL